MGKQEGIEYLLDHPPHRLRHQPRRRPFWTRRGGTSLQEFTNAFVELNVTDYVTFTGRVPDEVLLEMLNTADVCVNPDVANAANDMSTMNKIMEYMALGKPIVHST